MWWVQGKGMLLADGLLVSEAERPEGYVINLRGRHRPELSVDRNRFLGYDEGQVEADLKEAIPALIRSAWQPFPLEWLWNLADSWPRLAEEAIAELMAHDVRVSVPPRRGIRTEGRSVVALREVGCLPADVDVVQGSSRPSARACASSGRGAPACWAAWSNACPPRPDSRGPPPRRGCVRARADQLVHDTAGRRRGHRVPAAEDDPSAAPVRHRGGAGTGGGGPARPGRRRAEPAGGDAVQGVRERGPASRRESGEAGDHAVRQALIRVSADEKVSLGVLAELFAQLSLIDPSLPAPRTSRSSGLIASTRANAVSWRATGGHR
ncbi:hypothetical protein ACFQ3Z_24225 [Streptomyces nogalater]